LTRRRTFGYVVFFAQAGGLLPKAQADILLLQRFSDGCAVRPRGQTFGGDPCLSTADTREALPARAQAHQPGRKHLKTALINIRYLNSAGAQARHYDFGTVTVVLYIRSLVPSDIGCC
jgi:hypothetical protein